MSRSILVGVALGVTLVGPVSAATRYFAPTTSNAVVIAGEIDRHGHIEHGSGFIAQRVAKGEYEIEFRPGTFPSGYAALVVEPIGEGITTQVHQEPGYGPIFHVALQYPGTPEKPDRTFHFIAAEEL